jgi:polysaccharide pyruvyl transferase WcaK-like protein
VSALRTLVHLANHRSNNIGNGALILGTESVLREDLGDVTFVPDAWDDYTLGKKTFDASFVDRVNASDGLLVGGAVMFNGSRHLKHTGTRLDMPLSLWSSIKRPIIFYGVSYGTYPQQPYHNRDRLRRFLESLCSSDNVLLGVRNDGCKEWMESVLGYTTDKIIPIPDPGLYVTTLPATHLEIDENRRNVVVAMNGEIEVYRFGGRWPVQLWQHLPGWRRRKRHYLKSLARVLERISSEYDANIILAPHCTTDYQMMGEFLAAAPESLRSQQLIASSVLKATAAPYFYDLYRRADLVLSMRIHSMDCALGMGTPFIAITSHPRMVAFMHEAGLSDMTVEILDPAVERAIYDRAVIALSDGSVLRARLANARSEMRVRTATFNERVARLLAA